MKLALTKQAEENYDAALSGARITFTPAAPMPTVIFTPDAPQPK